MGEYVLSFGQIIELKRPRMDPYTEQKGDR